MHTIIDLLNQFLFKVSVSPDCSQEIIILHACQSGYLILKLSNLSSVTFLFLSLVYASLRFLDDSIICLKWHISRQFFNIYFIKITVCSYVQVKYILFVFLRNVIKCHYCLDVGLEINWEAHIFYLYITSILQLIV